MSIRFAAGVSVLTLLTIPGRSAPVQGTVDFDRQVHPILAERCLLCHSAEKRSGALSLATYAGVLDGGRSGAAIKPGNSSGSLLMHRIRGDVQPRMPLGKEPLTAAEIDVIRRWIDEGARATPRSEPAKPKWEAPLSLERPPIPALTLPGWNAPLDRFVAAYLSRHRVADPGQVPDALFARRVYLDVWGLLPPPADLHAFIADRDPGKRHKLVAKLLAGDRNYAENWVSFWNDLLRNDEGVNYAGSRQSITDWLLPALKSNLPYNQFVSKLLDPAAPGDPEGFLIGVNWRGDISASQTPAMQAAQNTAQIFLGINLKCNSCHDSFISKWKLKDAYSLASYFSSDEKLQLYRCDAATGKFATPGFLFPELNRPLASGSLADRHAAIAAIFTDARDGRLPRTMVNRIWERLFGRGIVDPPDEMDSEPWSPEVLDSLASDFVAHGYDLKYLIGTILDSRAYQMPSVPRTSERERQYIFRGPEVRRISAEQFGDAIGSITGEWHVYQPQTARTGLYSREWHLALSPLTQALGRPIRDQVFSERNNQATTLQALELVNGESLTHWLIRGAQKMLGRLPPEPASAFDSGSIHMRGGHREPEPVPFDIDVSKADRLWLLVQDVDSYSPDKVEAVWANAELVNPRGATPLSALKPVDAAGLRGDSGPIDAGESVRQGVRAKTPSSLVYDIAGKGFTRFRGSVALEKGCLRDDIQPRIRFFVFEEEPNMERLAAVEPELPVPALPPPASISQLIDRVFWYALGRAPSAHERRVAEAALADPAHPESPSAAGLADLLWAIMIKPEFQLII